jgi:hypothetical protein
MTMHRGTLVAVVLLASVSAGLAFTGREDMREDRSPIPRILAFDTMYGVDGPFVGDANPIRGIIGDEAPWVVARSVHGSLDVLGHLRIRVRGLVFKNDPRVDPTLIGKNDEPTFRATVSCLTEDSETAAGTQNVTTAGFPANVRGDSNIDATLLLPNPCVAPIVFILAGSEDKWFAVTGVETGPAGIDREIDGRR